MITQVGSYYNKVADYVGLSTDGKPTDVENGSTLFEMDTGNVYIFDAANKVWYKI